MGDVKHLASDAKIDSYHLGFYAGVDGDHISLCSGLSYSWHDADITRRVAFGDFEEVLQSQRGASTVQGFAEVGYRMQLGSLEVEPFAGLAHVLQTSEGGHERGGDAAQRVAKTSMETTCTTLGGRITKSFTLIGMATDMRTMAGRRHAFGDRTPLARVAFAGGDPFTVRGVPIADDALTLDVGLGLALSHNAPPRYRLWRRYCPEGRKPQRASDLLAGVLILLPQASRPVPLFQFVTEGNPAGGEDAGL